MWNPQSQLAYNQHPSDLNDPEGIVKELMESATAGT